MGVFVTEVEGVTVIRPTGRLNAQATREFEKKIVEVLANDARVLFDFSHVSYVASGALRVVLAAAKTLGNGSGAMALCCLRPNVRDVFYLAGFASVLDIHDERAPALAALKQAN